MKHLVALSSLLFLSLNVSAQDPADIIIDGIISNNTELQAQVKAYQAQRLDDADGNALSDPEINFARVWGRHGIGNKLQLDVSQSFDWPGVYSIKSQSANMSQEVARLAYESACLQLATEARQLLVELVYVRQQLAVAHGLKRNFSQLREAIDKGVRGGELTVLDQRKMRIEEFEIDKQISDLRAQEQKTITSLQSMTTIPLDFADVHQYSVAPLLSLDEYLRCVESDPSVAVQAMTSELETVNSKVAQLSRFPSFTVGYQHQAEMGDRFNGFTVGINLPIFQGRNARKAALERKDAADLTQEMLVSKLREEVKGAYADIQIQKAQIEAYNNVFGDNKYLELLLKAYNGGQISVIEYLSEIHYYHQVMLTYLESEYNYNMSLVSLNRYVRK